MRVVYLLAALLLVGCSKPHSAAPRPHWVEADDKRIIQQYGHWECPDGWHTHEGFLSSSVSCKSEADERAEMEEYEKGLKPR